MQAGRDRQSNCVNDKCWVNTRNTIETLRVSIHMMLLSIVSLKIFFFLLSLSCTHKRAHGRTHNYAGFIDAAVSFEFNRKLSQNDFFGFFVNAPVKIIIKNKIVGAVKLYNNIRLNYRIVCLEQHFWAYHVLLIQFILLLVMVGYDNVDMIQLNGKRNCIWLIVVENKYWKLLWIVYVIRKTFSFYWHFNSIKVAMLCSSECDKNVFKSKTC